MALSQSARVASVTTPLGTDVLLLYRMTGSDYLSRLFEYHLELLSEKGDIDLKSLLGKTMTVHLEMEDGSKRLFNGMVSQISQFGTLGNFYYYRATLHPKLWLLTRASNCRIMPANTTVPDIVKDVLSKQGYTDVETKLSGSYSPREFCVQYRETDFNFISRLLEEEGIYYYFKHSDSAHTLVLCDAMSAHVSVSENPKISYYSDATNRHENDFIHEWGLSQQIQSGSYVINDYDFEAPNSDLKSTSAIPGSHSESGQEVYDYPGEYTKTSDGSQFVKVRMEELRAEFEQVTARGNARQLATGYKFSLVDYPRNDQNRDYLVVSSQFHIQNNGFHASGIAEDTDVFQASYTLLSTEFTYRPPRITRTPIVQGVQTAIVVGKSGDEITTDKYGRIKIQFHWDRDGKKDENSSCWVRVAQVWAGKNWGGIHIPRVGQEVIVDFLEGNPDCPIVTGGVYNAEQMPPYDLPANSTQSGIKSRSSKDGSSDNFNEIRFEDKQGSEEIYIHAEKDFTRIVENNDVQKIGLDKKSPGDQTIDIQNNRSVSLEQGNDALTIKMGNRSAEIKQGNDSLKIAMGNRTVKVDLGSISEEAMQSILLKVGQNSITIDQTGVTIKGMMISIQGQVQTEVKGLMTSVSADTILTQKGAIVMIN